MHDRDHFSKFNKVGTTEIEIIRNRNYYILLYNNIMYNIIIKLLNRNSESFDYVRCVYIPPLCSNDTRCVLCLVKSNCTKWGLSHVTRRKS